MYLYDKWTIKWILLLYEWMLQEYRQKSKDWDLEKRNLVKQIESLESQRRTLQEKCDLIQVSDRPLSKTNFKFTSGCFHDLSIINTAELASDE